MTVVVASVAAAIGLAPPLALAGGDPVSPEVRRSGDAPRPGLLDAVRGDAARRSSQPVEQVSVSSFEAVTWPDGALGCPEPGRVYTQALVPGFRIVVRAGSDELVYHASARGHWVWCPPGRAVPPIQRAI